MKLMLNILLILSIIFAMYELLKLIKMKVYWKLSIGKRGTFILILEGIYMLFLVVLTFTKYWYVGLTILFLSFLTAYNIAGAVRQKSELTNQIKIYVIADGVVSILAFLLLILKEIL